MNTMAETEPTGGPYPSEPYLGDTLESIERLEGELSPEVLELNQRTFDFLGIERDVVKEYVVCNIAVPTPEQTAEALRQGYTIPVIVDGSIRRKRYIRRAQKAFAEEYGSSGIYWDYWQTAADISRTQVAQHSNRPDQLYLIYLKPDQECDDAHPDTIDKNFRQCQEVLAQEREQNPSLDLRGLTLQEYIMRQAVEFQRRKANIDPGKRFDPIDSSHRTWLLEEAISVPDFRRPTRCLFAYWDCYKRKIEVHSAGTGKHIYNLGARFAVLPETLAQAGVSKS